MQVRGCANSCVIAVSGGDLQRYLEIQIAPLPEKWSLLQQSPGGASAVPEIPVTGGCWVSGHLRRSVPVSVSVSISPLHYPKAKVQTGI